jgi:hypothetical protein
MSTEMQKPNTHNMAGILATAKTSILLDADVRKPKYQSFTEALPSAGRRRDCRYASCNNWLHGSSPKVRSLDLRKTWQ